MVAISLYRGSLHRVTDPHRRWPLPPRALSIQQFKLLTRKRSLALDRLKPPKDSDAEVDLGAENAPVLSPKPEAEEESKEFDDFAVVVTKEEEGDRGLGCSAGDQGDVKLEVELDTVNKNVERKRELEQKLQVLNEKKHNLVQMLKQILNAEEEIKRRNQLSTALQTPVPPLSGNAAETDSIARQPPRLTVDVNFGNDSGGESDAAANHNSPAHLQRIHYGSPSAPSLSRSPFGSAQNNGNV